MNAAKRLPSVLVRLFLAVVALVPLQAAALETYRIGIDLGNTPGTGCSFSLGSVSPGALAGFELQVTVIVDSAAVPPALVSAEIQQCSGGSFGAASPLPGFQLILESGALGPDSIVGQIPSSWTGGATVARLAFHALSTSGSEDALFTTDGSPSGPPIVAAIAPDPIPALSPLAMAVLSLVLIIVAFTILRFHGGAAMFFLIVLAGAGAAGAAAAMFGPPVAIDLPDDSNPKDSRAEILAAYVAMGDGGFHLRLDLENIDVRAGSLFSNAADLFVTSVPGTGLLQATENAPVTVAEHFALVDGGDGKIVIQALANGMYLSVHGDGFVYADAATPEVAAKWVAFVESESSGTKTMYILLDGPAALNVQVLQYDTATTNLEVAERSALDVFGDPDATFVYGE